MNAPVYKSVSQGTKPVICEEEVKTLARRLGKPARRTCHLQADERLYRLRWREVSDRRAEVVFALQDPVGQLWVHAKRNYPPHIFRLPSGGIHPDETVDAALLREVMEETHMETEVVRFLGVIDYIFHHAGSTARFASYVFLLRCAEDQPRPHAEENITEFRRVLPSQLRELAADLRNLIGDRHGWGQYRAISHDLVYEELSR